MNENASAKLTSDKITIISFLEKSSTISMTSAFGTSAIDA